MLTDLIAYLLGWPSNRLMIIDCDGCGRVRVCRRNGSRCYCSDCIQGQKKNRNGGKSCFKKDLVKTTNRQCKKPLS